MAKRVEPRVLHFHDCADVGRVLVDTAARHGYKWNYLSAEDIRPTHRPSNILSSKIFSARQLAKRWSAAKRAQILHVHYAMVVPAAVYPPMPKRPYFLHLHGTDIRKHWKNPKIHRLVQRWIDGAEKVYYTNLDTVEEATAARSDATFMPAFLDPEKVVDWKYSEGDAKKIIFLSRWEESKGVEAQLELVKALRKAIPNVQLEGLSWGDRAAEAESLGVNLVPKMSHAGYMNWISTAALGVGQARNVLGVSEFEAMASRLPVAVLGSRLPRPDDGSTPPVIEGSLDEVVDGVQSALRDPFSASEKLNAREWVFKHNLADPYIEPLQNAYRSTLGMD